MAWTIDVLSPILNVGIGSSFFVFGNFGLFATENKYSPYFAGVAALGAFIETAILLVKSLKELRTDL